MTIKNLPTKVKNGGKEPKPHRIGVKPAKWNGQLRRPEWKRWELIEYVQIEYVCFQMSVAASLCN